MREPADQHQKRVRAKIPRSITIARGIAGRPTPTRDAVASLDHARDRQGLAHARALRVMLDGVIASLDAEKDLPEKAAAPKPASVTRKNNPFA